MQCFFLDVYFANSTSGELPITTEVPVATTVARQPTPPQEPDSTTSGI